MRFIFVDRILELHPGRGIKAQKKVSSGEDYFQDHFPGFPVVPGVLLTEMMGQAAGKCLDAEDSERGKAMLARIDRAHFREWVKPGETVTLLAKIRSSRPQYAIAECSAEVNGKPVASAELFFVFLPRSQFSPSQDLVLEEYLKRGASAATDSLTP